jgi:hypothetical protein
MTITEIENAVKEGKTVHWMNSGYVVVADGAEFQIVWDLGGPNENYVGLLWEYKGKPYYNSSDFYIEE